MTAWEEVFTERSEWRSPVDEKRPVLELAVDGISGYALGQAQ
jgi:hypothetical protein